MMTFLRRILPLVLLLAMCLGAVACTTEKEYNESTAAQSISDLRSFLLTNKGVGKALQMINQQDIQVYAYLQKASVTGVKEGEEPLHLTVMTISTDKRYSFRLDLILDQDHPATAVRRFTTHAAGPLLMSAEDTLSIPTYTGAEFMSFDKAEYPPVETRTETETFPAVPEEKYLQNISRDMLNLLVITLDSYMEKAIKHTREDFGFVAYDEKNNPTNSTPVAALPEDAFSTVKTLSLDPGIPAAFLTADGLTPDGTETEADTATVGGADAPEEGTVAETEEDLGPALSPARVSYALRMTLLGMGMVFAVLALLWGVLAIFKVIFNGKTPKEPKKKPAPAPAPAAPVAAPVPAGTDPAMVAAITAAIAEMIAADPDLSAQYAGGFRVVSFQRKSGKTSWNH